MACCWASVIHFTAGLSYPSGQFMPSRRIIRSWCSRRDSAFNAETSSMKVTGMFSRDIPQRLAHPFRPLRNERRVLKKVEQRRNRAHALLLLQQSGLRQIACRTFANCSRWIVVKDVEEWLDGLVGAQQTDRLHG